MNRFPGRALTLQILGTSLLILLTLLIPACQSAPLCTDPAGCIYPNAAGKFELGIEVATVGDDVDSSHRLRDALATLLAETGPDSLSGVLQLVSYDSDCSQASRAQRTAQIAASPSLLALVGPACPDADSAYFKLLSDGGVSLLSSTLLPESAQFPGLYTLYPGLKDQAQALAKFLVRMIPAGGIQVFSQDSSPYSDFATLLCSSLGQLQRSCAGSASLADLAGSAVTPPDPSLPAVILLPFSTLDSLPDLPLTSTLVYYYDPLNGTLPASLSRQGSAILFQPHLADFPKYDFPTMQAREIYSLFQRVFEEHKSGFPGIQGLAGRSAIRSRLDYFSSDGLLPTPVLCKTGQSCPLPETAFTLRSLTP